MKRLVLSIGLLAAVVHCVGQTVSEANRSIRVQADERRAVVVNAVIDSPVVVELPSGESIDAIVRGSPDQQTWEVIKRDHRVFVRAMKGANPVSLTVVTKTKSFLFDLIPVVATPFNFANRVTRVNVDLVAPKKETAPNAEKPPVIDQTVVPATSNLSRPASSARRNREYSLQVVSESVNVRPREVFDDGRFTYFHFPSNLEVPVIYRSTPGTKDERIPNTHREGEFVVAHGVAPLWNLRIAGTVYGVFNDKFDPEGGAPVGSSSTVHLVRGLLK